MRLLIPAALAFGLALAARAEGPKDGPSEQVLDQVKSAVVRVLAAGCPDGERAASGFVWADQGVVTDLHVVAGCAAIKVNYQGIDNFPASVLRVLADADLALLKVAGAPAVPGLQAAERPPEVGERLNVFGYPLGVPRRDTMPVSVSYATKESPRLVDGLSPDAAEQLRTQGSPSLATEVLHVDGGNLVPGHSGAPLIDWQGRVLGIGSGGLASGSAGIGWAVRAQYLRGLPGAATAVPVLGAHAAAAFAYALPNRGAADSVACGEMTLYRTRQATLGAIAATSDDPDRIEGLANEIGGIPFETLRGRPATIWTERQSGAAIVVPDDATLAAGDPFCTLRAAAAEVSMLVRTAPLPMQAATVAWDLEKYRLQRQSFALINGVTKSGMRFRGHGLVAGPHLVNGAEVERRLGEASPPDGRQVRLYRADMAGRGAMVLVAAIAQDLRPDSLEPTRLAWAEAVLAVHLSSFPPRAGEARQQGIEPLPRGYRRIRCGDLELSPLEEAVLPAPADPQTEAAWQRAFGGVLPAPRPAIAWTVPRWGFRIYLPAGVEPRPEGDACVAVAADPALRYLIRLATGSRGAGNGAGEAALDGFRSRLAGMAGTELRPLAPQDGRVGAGQAGGPVILYGTPLYDTPGPGARAVAVLADLRPGFAVPCCGQALVGAVALGTGGRDALAEALHNLARSSAPPR